MVPLQIDRAIDLDGTYSDWAPTLPCAASPDRRPRHAPPDVQVRALLDGVRRVAEDQVDQQRPQWPGQVMAHVVDQEQVGAWDQLSSALAT